MMMTDNEDEDEDEDAEDEDEMDEGRGEGCAADNRRTIQYHRTHGPCHMSLKDFAKQVRGEGEEGWCVRVREGGQGVW